MMKFEMSSTEIASFGDKKIYCGFWFVVSMIFLAAQTNSV